MLTLVPAEDDRAGVVSRMLQLYAYDLSDVFGLDVSADGVFALPFPDRYWAEDRYHVFRSRSIEKLAGFAIVDSRSRFSEDATWDMNQFFVSEGTVVAAWVAGRPLSFNRFPGRWEVREALNNTAAQEFWRRVSVIYRRHLRRGPVRRCPLARLCPALRQGARDGRVALRDVTVPELPLPIMQVLRSRSGQLARSPAGGDVRM